ncbi:MAG: hypothetical protein ACYDHA_04105 [Bellilinea sp.]
MAKKQKRSVSVSQPKIETAVKPSIAAPSRTSTAEFKPDYAYVIKDLKRIGVLAGSFFVILIALSIFLR